jgi:tetratricopeptide (TPR) repeat protein
VWRLTWHLLRLLGVVALLVYGVAMSITLSDLRSETEELKAKLRSRDATFLLREQQLDEVFRQQSRQWRRGGPLSADELAVLQVWLTFDTAFAARNRRDGSLRCERAVALQRAGLCALLLGDCPRSVEHTREARQLYDELAASHPAALNYVADAAKTMAVLGEALEKNGEWDEAIRAYEAAIRLLGAPELLRTAADDRLLSEWTERLEALRQSSLTDR